MPCPVLSDVKTKTGWATLPAIKKKKTEKEFMAMDNSVVIMEGQGERMGGGGRV